MFQLSLPTRRQLVKAVEYAVVVFVGATVATWVKTPNPFSRDALIGAIGAGLGALYGLAKGLTTTL